MDGIYDDHTLSHNTGRSRYSLGTSGAEHEVALSTAAADGELWNLWYTFVPKHQETRSYIADALAGQQAGHMLPWAVRELTTDKIVGKHTLS